MAGGNLKTWTTKEVSFTLDAEVETCDVPSLEASFEATTASELGVSVEHVTAAAACDPTANVTRRLTQVEPAHRELKGRGEKFCFLCLSVCLKRQSDSPSVSLQSTSQQTNSVSRIYLPKKNRSP